MNKRKIQTALAAAVMLGAMSGNSINAAEVRNVDVQNEAVNELSRSVTGKGKVINVSKNLNVRKGPSTSDAVVGSLPNGTEFDILGKTGSWYKIQKGSLIGYVSADYVKVLSTNDSSKPSQDKVIGYAMVVNISGKETVDIRKEKSTSSQSLGKMSYGAGFDVLAVEGDWYKVKFYSTVGYVHKNNVKVLSGEIFNPTPTPPPVADRVIGYAMVVNISGKETVDIRKEKSTSSQSLGKMSYGAGFDVLAVEGDWYKVKFYSTVGYVHKNNVKVLSGEIFNPTPPPIIEKPIGYGKVVNISGSDKLNIRKEKSYSSQVVGQMAYGAGFDILKVEGSWVKVKFYDVVGYIGVGNAEVVSGNVTIPPTEPEKPNPSKQYGIVVNVNQGSSLRVRSSASTSSTVIGYVYPNQKVEISAKDGAWYKINFEGKTGFVHGDYIKIIDDNGGNTGGTTPSDTNKKKFKEVLDIMKTQVGSPYIYGGAGEIITQPLLDKLKGLYPTHANNGSYNIDSKYLDSTYRAFDCSGLMQWGFGRAGVKLGRNTKAQINDGVEVSLNSVQEGDLIFYKNLGHVGMYIGDGKWIESPKPGEFVRITNVPWSLVERVRRVI